MGSNLRDSHVNGENSMGDNLIFLIKLTRYQKARLI